MPDEPTVTVSYQNLLTNAAQGITQFIPDGATKKYDVRELLGLVQLDSRGDGEELLNILRVAGKGSDEASLIESIKRISDLSPKSYSSKLEESLKQMVQNPAIPRRLDRVEKKKPVSAAKEIKTVKIFLASSAELKEDRDAFELYFRQQNDHLRKEGIYLQITRWENFLDAMSSKGLQEEYNEEVRKCDIFVSLFMTKTGKYTAKEFNVAWQSFEDTGKPLIYTYFRETNVPINKIDRDDLQSLWAFQDHLKELKHYRTEYKSDADLHKQFRDQLVKLRAGDKL